MTQKRDSIWIHIGIMLAVYSAVGVCVLIGFVGGFILRNLASLHLPDPVGWLIFSFIWMACLRVGVWLANKLEVYFAIRFKLNEPI